MEMAVVSSLLVATATTELLQAGRLSVQQGGVRPTEPNEEAEDENDEGERNPERHLVLYHHVGRHGRTAGWLQVLGAALLLRLAGVDIVGIIQPNIRVHWTVFTGPELCALTWSISLVRSVRRAEC